MPGAHADKLVSRFRVTLRGRNALFHIFEMWIGLAGMISGVAFFVDSATTDEGALAQVIGRDLAAAWVVGYMIAGALIWLGLLRPSPRWEVVGLWLLGGATAANGVAVTAVFAWRATPTAATLFALTCAAWLRALVVYVDAIRLARRGDEGVASS